MFLHGVRRPLQCPPRVPEWTPRGRKRGPRAIPNSFWLYQNSSTVKRHVLVYMMRIISPAFNVIVGTNIATGRVGTNSDFAPTLKNLGK